MTIDWYNKSMPDKIDYKFYLYVHIFLPFLTPNINEKEKQNLSAINDVFIKYHRATFDISFLFLP